MENADGFLSDAELDRYLNEAIAELYDFRVSANPRLFASNGPQLESAGDYSWTLPNDFRQLVSVHIYDSGNYYVAEPADISEYAELAARDNTFVHDAKYQLREEFGTGTVELYLFPRISNASNIGYTYVKQAPQLETDTDEFHGTLDELQFIETAAAVKMLRKEESDTTALEAERSALWSRITNTTKDADLGAPRTVRNVRRRGYGN